MGQLTLIKSKEPALLTDLMAFYQISDSLFGWLLTLSVDELHKLKKELLENGMDQDAESPWVLFFLYFGKQPDIGDVIQQDEFFEIYFEFITKLMFILLVKKGMATYKAGDTDVMWQFDITDEGREYLKKQDSIK